MSSRCSRRKVSLAAAAQALDGAPGMYGGGLHLEGEGVHVGREAGAEQVAERALHAFGRRKNERQVGEYGRVGGQRQRQQRQGAQPLGAQAAPDLELDLGQVVQVHAWEPDGTTHVTYRGAPWRARLQQSADLAQPEPGSYRICALQGNLLLLEKV